MHYTRFPWLITVLLSSWEVLQVNSNASLGIIVDQYEFLERTLHSRLCCQGFLFCLDCSPLFSVCINTNGIQPICYTKKVIFGSYDNTHSIDFTKTLPGGVDNPIVFPFLQWTPNITVVVSVHHEEVAVDRLIETLALPITSSNDSVKLGLLRETADVFPRVMYGRDGTLRFNFNVKAWCIPNYYGSSCEVFCKTHRGSAGISMCTSDGELTVRVPDGLIALKGRLKSDDIRLVKEILLEIFGENYNKKTTVEVLVETREAVQQSNQSPITLLSLTVTVNGTRLTQDDIKFVVLQKGVAWLNFKLPTPLFFGQYHIEPSAAPPTKTNSTKLMIIIFGVFLLGTLILIGSVFLTRNYLKRKRLGSKYGFRSTTVSLTSEGDGYKTVRSGTFSMVNPVYRFDAMRGTLTRMDSIPNMKDRAK